MIKRHVIYCDHCLDSVVEAGSNAHERKPATVSHEFMEKNNYNKADLRKKIRDRRPARIPLIIRSDDMEPRKYKRLKDAANDIEVSKETLIYAYENRRSLITRRKGGVKVFYIEWL